MGAWFPPQRYDAREFVLRPYAAGDGAQLREANVESFEHVRRWLPWAVPKQTLEEAEIVVRRFHAKYVLHEDFVLGIFSPDEQRLLGGTGFHLHGGPLSSGCAEIGMFVRASEAGRGLGSRALAAMLRWGFSEWPWVRLSWRCDERNEASLRVAEKCGLRREGTVPNLAAGVEPTSELDRAEAGGPRLTPETEAGHRTTACYALTRIEWRAATNRAGRLEG